MSVADELLANNARYVTSFDLGDAPVEPAKKLAVVTCMDARIDVFGALGLHVGDVHVIRNAGGVVTDDVLRSLKISQRKAGTEEIMVIHHTDCAAVPLAELDAEVRRSVATVAGSPALPKTDEVRGFVYDVATGALREVT